MERAVLNWEDVGDLANIAQLTGLDAVKLIALVIKVTSNAVIRKERCRNFARHLKDIGDLLETIKITELMEYPEIRNPLKRLEDALKESLFLVKCCLKKRYFLVLENRLNQAQAKIDECLKIIPLIILIPLVVIVNNQRRQEHWVNARGDEEWKKKISVNRAAIQSFEFKQLLDEASEDITDKTNYEYFAKKWGHDQRFEALDPKERKSLLNERVLSLTKTLEEKGKAIQDDHIASFKAMLWNRDDINSSSQWSKVKDSLCCNSSYKAIKRKDREALFIEYLEELKVAERERDVEIKWQEEPAKEYYGQLCVGSYIEIFGRSMSYEELYVFLGPYLSSSEDPDVHFKYIEAAAKTGRIEVVERVTRESNFYDADKTKNFLMEARLGDARPLINVCERFGFVPDLIHYFYSNNMRKDIEYYIQQVNPINAPLVVGQLLDYACPEAFIEDLIMSVYFLLPVEPLVEECEKRNRLRLLTRVIERLVSEGSQDVDVHNALGKIIIDTNNNPENFLTTNPYYDSRVVGKYCEKRDPTLAVVAYRRG